MNKRTLLFLVPAFFLVFSNGNCQDRGMKPIDLSVDGKPTQLYKESHALVIGISNYTNGWPQLPGVTAEIETVKNALISNGFQVEVVMDPNKDQLDRAFTGFISKYGQSGDNRLLFFFAGHGYTLKTSYGEDLGYIVPNDAPNPNYDVSRFQSDAMEMAQIEIYARRIQAKHALFIFDACFSGSLFSSTRAVPEIINYKTTLPVRQFITSGSADEMVPDKSVFAEQFIGALNGDADIDKDSYITGSELGEYLQRTVVNYTRNSQHPQYGKIRSPNLDKGDFVFVINTDKPVATPPPAVPPPQVAVVPPANAVDQTRSNPSKTDNDKQKAAATELIPMIYVEGGAFEMGNKHGEGDEKPQHLVRLNSFYIGKFEITQKQWRDIFGTNPSGFPDCDECPVERVSYNDAMAFINVLNSKTGKKYRLPTEAEWEYAARGGTKGLGYKFAGGNGIDILGWNDDNARGKTHPVGKKMPNELGLYDMCGNVYEWCNDWYEDNYYKKSNSSNPAGPATSEWKVVRGGSWKLNPKDLTVTNRYPLKPGVHYNDVGFRIVREE
jgi:formylglycine-generating enzyme required for sulfatase activity